MPGVGQSLELGSAWSLAVPGVGQCLSSSNKMLPVNTLVICNYCARLRVINPPSSTVTIIQCFR